MKIYKGNVEVHSSNVKEWEQKLKDIGKISGNLYINSDAELKALKSVGGSLSIHSNAELKAEALKSVGGGLYIDKSAKVSENIKVLQVAREL